MLKGIAASAGIGLGKAVLIKQDDIVVVKRIVEDPVLEQKRLKAAVDRFCTETMTAYHTVKQNIGESEAGILSAQVVLVSDPELIGQVTQQIRRESVSAEYALSSVCERYVALFSHMEDELMRARAADFRDIKNRLLYNLLGIRHLDISEIAPGSVLVAKDISPSQIAAIQPGQIAAIVTQMGTGYSHLAIIARALQLPAVVAVDNLLASVREEDSLVVDGVEGLVLKNPGKAQLAHYKEVQSKLQSEQERLASYRCRPTVTADGKRIVLSANLSVRAELPGIKECDVDGIGLFRTEFLYMEGDSLPGEQQQFEIYRQIAKSMGEKPVVVRVLDMGGDKEIPSVGRSMETNPFLGHRGVRFLLDRTDIFKTQLSALLRAGVYGKLRLLVPMVTCVSEFRQVKALLQTVKAELRAKNIAFCEDIPLGVMVETPAAALCADALAREADFFSLGTNDLTQYTLCVDRDNEKVSGLYSAQHPAVLRLIRRAVRAAACAGIPVCVCGEAASDPLLLPLLVGMGINELSVNASSLLAVRKQLSGISYAFWQDKAEELLELSTAEEVFSAIQGLLRL